MHRFIRCCCFICPAPFLPVRLFYDYRSLFFAIHIDRYGFGKPDVADEFFFFDQLLISNNVVIDEGAVRFVRYGKVSDIHGSHIVKEMGLMDKVVFGSDYPLLSPQRYEKGLMSSGLKEEDIEKLMGLNAAKLLEL